MLRRLLPHLCAIPLSALLWAPGCAKQGEGDRCDPLNGNQDCESGLICVSGAELVDDSADRCCPPVGQTISSDSCL
ncbi:MAG: hypothetical protein DYH12_19595, partial [Sorangiineae bacterium PRO1]|nr:hypothetical protein [Sorangiineae bacterium PRO1]